MERSMNRAEFRAAFREARKVRRFERIFTERLQAAGLGRLISVSCAVPARVYGLTFPPCDFLAICKPHVGLTPRSRFGATPRLPA